jgi:hypothetical protein
VKRLAILITLAVLTVGLLVFILSDTVISISELAEGTV